MLGSHRTHAAAVPRRLIVLIAVAITVTLAGAVASLWAVPARADAARPVGPAGSDGSSAGVATVLATDQPISLLAGPQITGSGLATAQPGTDYTVLCYATGAKVTDIHGLTSSPTWALLADPADPKASLGYLPAVGLKITDLQSKVPDCATQGYLPPKEKQKETTDTETEPKYWPFLPPPGATDNDDQGPGEACVFARSSGAGGLGHTGWAFKLPAGDVYEFGATESVPSDENNLDSRGKLRIPKGDPNGTWDVTASRNQMIQTFRNPTGNPQVAATTPWAKPYDEYRCQTTEVSHVALATAAVAESKRAGYDVLRNNCLDNTIKILRAYGATGLPDAKLLCAAPRIWFKSLTAPWSPIQDLNATAGMPDTTGSTTS
ncbi:hypothetical protein [Actinoallomurus iriomotensis]|uniref:Uncharacterized protein n=1 Tax=Actinoallomurus iriomotensis TaxID=478107 RepID=A0A9W6W1N8_9ACTN|nr:hypothetical protein [Actinoallomurus iriomotensis]GLY87007.1 hypothetical protein Airi02_049360 [Actinoallomurus iriomotensis]